MLHEQTTAHDPASTSVDPSCGVAEALAELRAGRMVVVTGDDDRHGEGDLVMAAEFVTPESITFMATHGRGLICLALTAERCLELGLRPMTSQNESRLGTAFTVSIEARTGVTTGISAADRARTVQVAVDPRSGPCDVVSPGHMFPIRARPGGVLERRGQTEAAVDLTRLAGLTPAGVVCGVMNDDGTMARVPDLRGFCAAHGLRMLPVAALAEHRRGTEHHVDRVPAAGLPTALDGFRIMGYRSPEGHEHVALVLGDVEAADDVLVHVQRADLVDDVFAVAGDGETAQAMRAIQRAGRGVLVFVSGRDRLDHLVRRLTGTASADGIPTRTPDHALAARVLGDLGLSSVRLFGGDRLAVEELTDAGLPATLALGDGAGPREG